MHVWALSSYHREEEAVSLLEKNGFKINKVELTGPQFLELNKPPVFDKVPIQPGQVVLNPRLLYPRARFLWSAHNKKFTEWERTFVYNIGGLLKAGRSLSPKQLEHLNKLFDKYKVALDAVASDALDASLKKLDLSREDLAKHLHKRV